MNTFLIDKLGSESLEDVVNYKKINGNTIEIISYNKTAKPGRVRVLKKIVFDSDRECSDAISDLEVATTAAISPHLRSKTPREKRRVLVLINPFSGQKKAVKLWEDHAAQVFEDCGVEVELKYTEHTGHATEIAAAMNIEEYDAVVINSGDGLVSEVLSGLLSRSDVTDALKLPILHIPGGTSNALAASVCYASNEAFTTRDVFITEACYLYARPKFLKLAMYTVETSDSKSRNMFMSSTWGLIADIDLASERFRWAGMIRLHMEATIRILQLPSTSRYKAKITYKPVDCKEISRNTLKTCGDYTSGTTHPYKAYDRKVTRMPPIGTPLGDDWVTIEGEWVMANVTTISHIGSDIPFIPTAKLDEPIMYLTLIDWKTLRNRLEIAMLFVTMSEKKHLSYPCFQVIPVYGVRIEPDPTNINAGMFAVDGEPMTPGSAFQIYPSPYEATVVGR